jgi:hypothetical protein
VTSETLAAWVGSVGIVLTLLAGVVAWTVEQAIRRKERDRSQAEKVAAWYAGSFDGQTLLSFSNASALPIYEVVVSLVFVQGAAPQTMEDWVELGTNSNTNYLPHGAAFTAVGPGEWSQLVAGGWGAMGIRPGCEIAFTDASGRHWVRRGNGDLKRITKNPIDHYGLPRPVDYQAPQRTTDLPR